MSAAFNVHTTAAAAHETKLFAVKSSGLFIWIDTAISWMLYGVVCVQMINYFTLLRSRVGRGRESAGQIWSIAAVWMMLTGGCLTTLDRSIKINSAHFGDVAWTDDFKNRPHGALAFAFGFCTITLIQILLLQRALAFVRTIVTDGNLGVVRYITYPLGFLLHCLWVCSGILAEYYLRQYPSYSQMIADVADVGTRVPCFLIFQVTWLASGLLLAMLLTFNLSRDVIQARRFNSTDHPNVKLTNEVLYQLLSAMIGNWVYICAAHAVYIFAVTYRRSAIAGRGTACLPLVYAFSLMRMITAPRQTRSRQIMESEGTGLPQHFDRSPASSRSRPPAKRLFGFHKFSKKRSAAAAGRGPASTSSAASTTSADIGFFSMLRGADARRRPSVPALLQADGSSPSGGVRRRGSSLVGGVLKTIEVLSYSRREKEFQLLEAPAAAAAAEGRADDADEAWVRKNQLMGIGNAVWVETPTIRRPLSANEHYPTPQPSPQPSASSSPGHLSSAHAFSLKRAATIASSRTTARRSRAKRSLAPRFDTLSAPAAHPSSTGLAGARAAMASAPAAALALGGAPEPAHLGERRAQISFVDSFPTGPVVSLSYGTYDPDLDDFELPSLSLDPVHEPLGPPRQ